MTETWKRTEPRRRTIASGSTRLALLSVVSFMLLAGFLPSLTAASDVTTGDSRLLAPIADVLSASSWLWATGQDPRHPSATGASALWQPADGSPATPAAPGANLIVSKPAGQFPVSSEPHLAVDPTDPDHLVLAVSAFDLPSVATYASDDGGETWDGPLQAPYFARDEASLGAPAVTFDRQGNVFLVSQSVAAETLAVGIQKLPVERIRITISLSDDGGRHWGGAVSAVTANIETAFLPDPGGLAAGGITTEFLDSPAIAVGPDPQRPDREIIAIAYTELRTSFILSEAPERVRLSAISTESTIRVIRSADGGRSWSEPAAVSPTAARSLGGAPAGGGSGLDAPLAEIGAPVAPAASTAASGDGDQIVQGPQMAILADGTIALAYLDTTRDGPRQGLARVMTALSRDGGRTFSEPRQAGLFREIADRPATAFFRWWDGAFPRIATGPDDELYIAVAVRLDGEANSGGVQLFRSLDRGESWGAPGGEPDDGAGSPFFPAIDVAPDGTLYAIWGELGGEPAGAGYAIRAAASIDQGETWRSLDGQDSAAMVTELSDATSNALLGFPRGHYLGSRLALVAEGGRLYAAWPSTQEGAGSALGQQVAIARRVSGD